VDRWRSTDIKTAVRHAKADVRFYTSTMRYCGYVISDGTIFFFKVTITKPLICTAGTSQQRRSDLWLLALLMIRGSAFGANLCPDTIQTPLNAEKGRAESEVFNSLGFRGIANYENLP
jgi:hypothetical protein